MPLLAPNLSTLSDPQRRLDFYRACIRFAQAQDAIADRILAIEGGGKASREHVREMRCP
jgi:hypothetical protein